MPDLQRIRELQSRKSDFSRSYMRELAQCFKMDHGLCIRRRQVIENTLKFLCLDFSVIEVSNTFWAICLLIVL
jgi:hypothetical protein